MLKDNSCITKIIFSPDGNLLVKICLSGSVGLWDIHSKKRIGISKSCAHTIRKVVFMADRQHLATTVAGCTIKLWKAGSVIEIHEFVMHPEIFSSLTFSQDSKFLTL